MRADCAGGSGRDLVEARFLRSLVKKEQLRLEEHLVRCPPCVERYRRLQLAERIAANGPDRAWHEPSPLEIERMAEALELGGEGARPSRAWFGAFALAVASAAAISAIVLSLPPREELLERGSAGERWSFAAYLISSDGAVRPHRASEPAHSSDHLKLRIARDASAPALPRVVSVVLVSSEVGTGPGDPVRPAGDFTSPITGWVRTVTLEAPPEMESAAASVPGAIPLRELEPGRLVIYLVAAERSLDRSRLESAARAKPSAADLRAAIDPGGEIVIERIEVELLR